MTQDFTTLLRRLVESGLDFVVIGGFAAVTHGSAYLTRGVEICTVLTPENVTRLRTALADWHPRHRMTPQRLSFLDHPSPGATLNNLCLETDQGVVDVLTSVLGVGDFVRLKNNAEKLEIDGVRVRVMSLSDLIAAKEALGRERTCSRQENSAPSPRSGRTTASRPRKTNQVHSRPVLPHPGSTCR